MFKTSRAINLAIKKALSLSAFFRSMLGLADYILFSSIFNALIANTA